MAENIAAEILAPVIEDGVKRAGATIIRQFNYLCCFTSNIATLKDEARALDDEARGLQGRVDGARNDTQIIVPAVETWMTKSEAINAEMDEILNEVPNVGSGCLKLKSRFSLSKRAKKTTDRMKDHRGQCKFDVISHPRPPAATEAVPLGTTYEFQSRKQIEEDIMTSLRDGDVNMIGICGMGGLGKTTMAKMIMNRALKEHVFEEVVMAVVSQPVDELKIQVEIGELLGLKNLKEQASMGNRRQMLHARLTEGTKRILLVLDDIWESLKVEDIGIPRGCKGCTILLTSRNRDILRAMDVENVFGMEVLPEEEAWFLFIERAGTCVDACTQLNSMAKEVVEECKGLPIALTTVGAALKDETDKGIWKDVVWQLKKANLTNIPDFIKEVYTPLKISYDRLDSKEAKSVFLLCSLFGEDDDIPLEKLTYFCMGLGKFEGGMEEGRNRMRTLTKILKNRSLLLESDEEDCVRMHDVVRDVCIFIAKQEGYIGHNDCTWLSSSSFQQGGGRTGSSLLTNLRLLFLTCNPFLGEEKIKLDNSFVEGIKDLHVLCIEFYSFTSLPHPTPSLKNLKTLVLNLCDKLETLSVVGELVNLEILICRNCYSIKELPPEMKGLDRLKLLDLTSCVNLERIAPGIISSLVGLEEMKMLWSFEKWEASDSKERENANGNAELRELESLINLKCLEIEIEDAALVAEKMRLSSKLDRFQIRIPFPSSWSADEFFSYSSNKILSLKWEGGSCVGDWIKMLLLNDTECLHLTGNGANNVYYLANTENIRWLELGKCENMKNIGRTSSFVATVFPSMEFLNLFSLPNLKEIWDGPISLNSFQNLTELLLTDLPTLKLFWKSSSIHHLSTVNCLPQLEVLKIAKCEMMEQVFSWNEEDDQNINGRQHITKMFPKLKEVKLSYLPNLTTFFQGIEGIEFPLLREMLITACPKMTGMVSSNENNSGGSINTDNIDDHHSFLLFCEPEKVSFGNLKELTTDRNPFSCGHRVHESLFNGLEELEIDQYGGSMSLFSPSVIGNLVNLIELTIRSCAELVEVIKDDEEEDRQRTTLQFPKLQRLWLLNLPKLVSFCEWKCDVELPSLRQLNICECPNMKYFTLGFLTAPDLEAFTLLNINNFRQVPYDNQKVLSIQENENPFYPYIIPVSLFNGLQQLAISEYKGSMSLFTSSTVENLVSLRELSIYNCDEMVKVIYDEEEKEKEEEKVMITQRSLFPKLQKLRLDSLPKLVSFCEWKCDVELGSLRELNIHGCPNMKYFTLGLLTAPDLEAFVLVNFNNCRQVPYDNQKVLSIEGNENPFYPYIIPVSLFNGLQQLTVREYKGSMSLFTSSTVEIVSLRILSVHGCDEMVKVIEDEEEKAKEEEKVVISAAAQRTTLLFPELQELQLYRSPKLVSFCEWKCDIEFRSLRKVEVKKCPNLKYFTLGLLTTPKLESILIDYKDFGGVKHLNDALQQHYLAQEKEKEEEEKKGGAEEQETKGSDQRQ